MKQVVCHMQTLLANVVLTHKKPKNRSMTISFFMNNNKQKARILKDLYSSLTTKFVLLLIFKQDKRNVTINQLHLLLQHIQLTASYPECFTVWSKERRFTANVAITNEVPL